MPKRNKNKANKNAKSTKPGTQTNAPTRRTSGNKPQKVAVIPRGLVEQVCGVTDPFCPHAYGAKVFDMARVRTVSMPYNTRVTYSTNVSGELAVLLVPNYLNDFGLVGSVAANNAGYTTGVSRTGSPTVTQYRIVSLGYIVSAVQAPLNQAGTVHMRMFTAATGVNFDLINVSTYNCDAFLDIPVCQLGKGYPIVVPRNDLVANVFNQTDQTWAAGANITAWFGNGWPVVQICVTGGAVSTPVIAIQQYVHFEVTYPDNSTNQQLATFSPPAHPAVVGAVTQVQSKIEAFAHKTVESVSRGVKSAAREALLEAIRGVPNISG